MTTLIGHHHPYAGGAVEGNFFKSGWAAQASSWAEFMEYAANWDLDYHLVFRWDWSTYKRAGEEKPFHTLTLWWVQQRKGILGSTCIAVTEADEPAARAWLAIRWAHLQRMWEPLSAIPSIPVDDPDDVCMVDETETTK